MLQSVISEGKRDEIISTPTALTTQTGLLIKLKGVIQH